MNGNPNQSYLEHYGILGMKWGIRRTPEQLGHKRPNTPVEKWKAQHINSVNRLYDKSYKKLDKALAQNPGDKSIIKYKKTLQKQQVLDVKEIESLTYMDIQERKKAEKEERTQKRDQAVARVGNALMWTGRMAIIGLRIGGTAVAINILSDAGATAINYINSEEGKAALKTGTEVVQKLGNLEIFGFRVFQAKSKDIAPNSSVTKALNSIDMRKTLPGENYMAPAEFAKNVQPITDMLD